MRKTAILGIGQIKIGEHWERSLREIGGDAAFSAMQDADLEKVDSLFVGNMLSPMVNGQNQLGTFFADWIGMWKQESVKIEAACGSGAAAFRSALMAVASGDVESALVVGVEKMTDKAGRDVTAALATAADADYEVEQGISFVGINALVMRRYMHEFGWKHEDFAPFSINAHANAMHNPFARLHEKITVEKFEKSSMVATPISGIILIPVLLLLAVLLPGNRTLPLVDLIAISFIIQPFVAASNGNIFKTVVLSAIWFAVGLYICTITAPLFTEVYAQFATTPLAEGTMVTSGMIANKPIVGGLIFLPILNLKWVGVVITTVVWFPLYFLFKKNKVRIQNFMEEQAALDVIE